MNINMPICKGRGFNCHNCEKKFKCNDYKFNPVFEKGIGVGKINKASIQRIDYEAINERYKAYVRKNAEIEISLEEEKVSISNEYKFVRITRLVKKIIGLYKRNLRLVAVLEAIESARDSFGATNEEVKVALSICDFNEFDEIAFSLSEEK